MEFDFIRRISKTRFQKFFKEKQTFVLEQSSLVKDGHLEEFTRTTFDRFLKRFFNDFELCDLNRVSPSQYLHHYGVHTTQRTDHSVQS